MEWKTYNVCELCESVSETYKGNAREVVLVNTSDVLDGKCLNHHYVPSVNLKGQFKKLFRENDILYSEIRPANKRFCYVDFDSKNYVASTKLMVLRCRDNTEPRYLFQVLRSAETLSQLQALAESRSGTFPQITYTELANISVSLPSLNTQRRIASILSSLDRKIELNNKINAQLEEMAQALFKEWFVDFGPFKDGKFVESELGLIPEGWRLLAIKDIPHRLETGRRPKGGVGNNTDGIPSIGAEHVKGMGSYDYSKTKYIPHEYASQLKTGKIEGYELLIYKDGGKPGYFIPNYSIFGEGYPFEECYLNEHVFKLDFNVGKWYNIFCFFYFQTDYVMNYLNAQGGKAAIPGINKNDIESLWILSPENDKVRDFGNFALPLFTSMLKRMRENKELSQLRDTLLPKLMNGEISLDK